MSFIINGNPFIAIILSYISVFLFLIVFQNKYGKIIFGVGKICLNHILKATAFNFLIACSVRLTSITKPSKIFESKVHLEFAMRIVSLYRVKYLEFLMTILSRYRVKYIWIKSTFQICHDNRITKLREIFEWKMQSIFVMTIPSPNRVKYSNQKYVMAVESPNRVKYLKLNYIRNLSCQYYLVNLHFCPLPEINYSWGFRYLDS